VKSRISLPLLAVSVPVTVFAAPRVSVPPPVADTPKAPPEMTPSSVNDPPETTFMEWFAPKTIGKLTVSTLVALSINPPVVATGLPPRTKAPATGLKLNPVIVAPEISLPLVRAEPLMPAGKTNPLVTLLVINGTPEGFQLPAKFHPVVAVEPEAPIQVEVPLVAFRFDAPASKSRQVI